MQSGKGRRLDLPALLDIFGTYGHFSETDVVSVKLTTAAMVMLPVGYLDCS